MSQIDPSDLIDALSQSRLSSYRNFFGTHTDSEALGLYFWNEDLADVFFRTISLIEIVLRNQFHRQLSGRYGTHGATGTKDWYKHLALNKESNDKLQKILNKKSHKNGHPGIRQLSPDDVVSKLPFGFWPHLLDVKHDLANNPVPWGQILTDMLPGHRQKNARYWSKQSRQDQLFARIDLCNALRNRIAHHEPIWKLGPLMQEARPRPNKQISVLADAPSNPEEALNRLRILQEKMVELMGWIAPRIQQAYSVSETAFRTTSLINERTLLHYKARRTLAQIDISGLKGVRAFRKIVRRASRQRQPLHLKDGVASLGHLFCPDSQHIS